MLLGHLLMEAKESNILVVETPGCKNIFVVLAFESVSGTQNCPSSNERY